MTNHDIYQTPEWHSLNTWVRAHILLVAEGHKRGAGISLDGAGPRQVSEKFAKLNYVLDNSNVESVQGLIRMVPKWHPKNNKEIKCNTRFYKLNIDIAQPGVLAELNEREKALPIDNTFENPDNHKLHGWFYGYPECCTEEYIKQRNQDNWYKHGNHKFQSLTSVQIKKLIDAGKEYPDIFDYTICFTPCSLDCPEAIRKLSQYKEALETHDPEAAEFILRLNRQVSLKYSTHKGWLKKSRRKVTRTNITKLLGI
jgi:hypothetical protein